MASGGTSPTHLDVNDKGTALYVANYGNPGSFAAFNLDKESGEILEPAFTDKYGRGSNAVPDRKEYIALKNT